MTPDNDPNHRTGSGKIGWYTPQHVLDAARSAMGGEFTLDPSSCEIANRTVRAARFITVEQDALAFWTTWIDAAASSTPVRIWLNPPYARGIIGQFATKLIDTMARAGDAQAVSIVNADTGTIWFHDLLKACSAVCHVKGRISFIDADTMKPQESNNYSQAVFYFGAHFRRFSDAFQKLGTVVIPVSGAVLMHIDPDQTIEDIQ